MKNIKINEEEQKIMNIKYIQEMKTKARKLKHL